MRNYKNFFFSVLTVIFMCILLTNCQPANSQQDSQQISYVDSTLLKPDKHNKVHLSDAQWKKLLTPSAYAVLREQHTEFAYTGALLKNKKKGIYTCGGCGQPLFSSDTKFESGTGWPSFYDVVSKNAVTEIRDNGLGMTRVEVICSRCEGHLGHVFEDGPVPTGLRYCMNSAALKFEEKK